MSKFVGSRFSQVFLKKKEKKTIQILIKIILMQVTFIEKPSMNYINDLDECLTYFKTLHEYTQF